MRVSSPETNLCRKNTASVQGLVWRGLFPAAKSHRAMLLLTWKGPQKLFAHEGQFCTQKTGMRMRKSPQRGTTDRQTDRRTDADSGPLLAWGSLLTPKKCVVPCCLGPKKGAGLALVTSGIVERPLRARESSTMYLDLGF